MHAAQSARYLSTRRGRETNKRLEWGGREGWRILILFPARPLTTPRHLPPPTRPAIPGILPCRFSRTEKTACMQGQGVLAIINLTQEKTPSCNVPLPGDEKTGSPASLGLRKPALISPYGVVALSKKKEKKKKKRGEKEQRKIKQPRRGGGDNSRSVSLISAESSIPLERGERQIDRSLAHACTRTR